MGLCGLWLYDAGWVLNMKSSGNWMVNTSSNSVLLPSKKVMALIKCTKNLSKIWLKCNRKSVQSGSFHLLLWSQVNSKAWFQLIMLLLILNKACILINDIEVPMTCVYLFDSDSSRILTEKKKLMCFNNYFQTKSKRSFDMSFFITFAYAGSY